MEWRRDMRVNIWANEIRYRRFGDGAALIWNGAAVLYFTVARLRGSAGQGFFQNTDYVDRWF